VRFRRSRSGGVEAKLQPVEVAVLASAARDLLELLGDQDGDAPRDPLEALVGLSPGARRPDDPALRRLFPDAYREDAFGADSGPDRAAAAAAASAEFRRFTDADLRAGKRAHADTVLETLVPLAEEGGGGRLRLNRDQADAWLGFLNDVRLVMGVRLDVDEDTLEEGLADPSGAEDEARAQALAVYSWLGWVQETLLAGIDPR
jgi:hypothetical protein